MKQHTPKIAKRKIKKTMSDILSSCSEDEIDMSLYDDFVHEEEEFRITVKSSNSGSIRNSSLYLTPDETINESEPPVKREQDEDDGEEEEEEGKKVSNLSFPRLAYYDNEKYKLNTLRQEDPQFNLFEMPYSNVEAFIKYVESTRFPRRRNRFVRFLIEGTPKWNQQQIQWIQDNKSVLGGIKTIKEFVMWVEKNHPMRIDDSSQSEAGLDSMISVRSITKDIKPSNSKWTLLNLFFLVFKLIVGIMVPMLVVLILINHHLNGRVTILSEKNQGYLKSIEAIIQVMMRDNFNL